MTAGYTFGDTQTAQQRLDLVAAVFDPPSRAFLVSAVPEPPMLACDLGCGPGHTTRMLRSVTGARRVIGLDVSAEFVRAAGVSDGMEFRVWEAGAPLPADPDLVYARLLLSHLTDPAPLAASWASQLAPGGRLLLDEVERIETDSDVLREYLDIVVARVAAGGAQMYAGPLLDGIDNRLIVRDEVVAHPVAAADAALMFRLNLSVWADWAARRFGHDVVTRLDRELARIAAGQVRCEISWWLRQMVIRQDR